MTFTTNAILILVSIVLAVMRIGGVKGESFQAVAHLWVGGLFASGGTEHYYTWGTGTGSSMVKIELAVVLSLVELACFLFLPHS
jgi:hypothetical protein